MKPKLFNYLLLVLLCLTLAGCQKDDDNKTQEGEVELYLVDAFTKNEWGQIEEETVITKPTPLVKYTDFLAYNAAEHAFELSNDGRDAVANLEQSLTGVAFAIKANNDLIYTGYFWPSYSSAGCAWVVIDPIMANVGNNIYVKLGYPGLPEDMTIPDKRNDERIIAIFKRDNKLK